jgi:hypothetical protein
LASGDGEENSALNNLPRDAAYDSMDALENSCVKGPMFGAQTQVAAHNTFVFRRMKAREEANLL